MDPFALTKEFYNAPITPHMALGPLVVNVAVLAGIVGGTVWAIKKLLHLGNDKHGLKQAA